MTRGKATAVPSVSILLLLLFRPTCVGAFLLISRIGDVFSIGSFDQRRLLALKVEAASTPHDSSDKGEGNEKNIVMKREVDLLRRENDVLKRELALQAAEASANKKSTDVNKSVDLDREAFRLDSFDTYVLVSALISTTSLSTLVFFMPIDDPNMELQFPKNILCLLTQVTSIYCVMSSLLATIVFSLEELYGKSALGIQQDETYREFLEKTTSVRMLGFQAFSSSLLLFAVQAGLVAIERVRGVPNKSVAAFLSALGIVFIFSNWAEIVKDASPIYMYLGSGDRGGSGFNDGDDNNGKDGNK